MEDGNDSVIGFYNISAGCIDGLSDGIRYKMGGSVHINEFAIDQKYQKAKIEEGSSFHFSDVLLMDCINRIKYIRDNYIGFSFVTLQSTEEGYRLYSRNDFEEIEEDMNVSKTDKEKDCIPMYLALDIE